MLNFVYMNHIELGKQTFCVTSLQNKIVIVKSMVLFIKCGNIYFLDLILFYASDLCLPTP